MSPRPRKATDAQVFQAAMRAMHRLGPGELTLAHIAAEAGITAGALVQRFGSKRDLLLALAAEAASAGEGFLTGIRARHRSPLAALRDYVGCLAGLADSPAALQRNLAWLQIDLTDPDFRVHLVRQATHTRQGIERLVREAVAQGELHPGTRPTRLARTIESILSGSVMTWAIYQQGTAARWLRRDLELVLHPWLP